MTGPCAMPLTKELPDHVRVGREEAILEEIRTPGCNLAIWTRDQGSLSPEAILWLDNLTVTQIPDKQLYVSRDLMPESVRAECERTMPKGPERNEVIEDLIARVDKMFEFTGNAILKVRLDRVDGKLCTRFHQDAVGVRMLCTYKGLGTEWIPNEAVMKEGVGVKLRSKAERQSKGLVSRHLPRFAVGYLKGCNAPDGSFGIVHRSPDFIPRMLLCVEPPDVEVFDDLAAEI